MGTDSIIRDTMKSAQNPMPQKKSVGIARRVFHSRVGWSDKSIATAAFLVAATLGALCLLDGECPSTRRRMPDWNVGDKCSVYSKKDKTWYDDGVIEAIDYKKTHPADGQCTPLKVRYNLEGTVELQDYADGSGWIAGRVDTKKWKPDTLNDVKPRLAKRSPEPRFTYLEGRMYPSRQRWIDVIEAVSN